jgi:hypothetical protein
MPPLPELPPPPAPPKVDPGELALAVVGVTALIDGDPPKMGKGRQDEAYAIPDKAVREARHVFDQKREHKYTPLKRHGSYRAMLDRFTKGLQSTDVYDFIGMFPPEASEMAGAFQLTAQNAFEHMKQMFPTTTVTGFLGPANITPDDVRVWRFFSQLEVLDDPLRVFNLIESAALLKSQVDAARAIYPTLTKLFDAALYEAMGLEKAAKQSYRIPPRTEQGLSVWFGRRFVEHQPPQPPAPPPSPGAPGAAHGTKVADGLATRTQKASENI